MSSDDTPPPETSVVPDGGRLRCELVVYICKGGLVKDIRLRGPARASHREALKDCIELRNAAVKNNNDPSLKKVRDKRQELEDITWTEKDLGGRQLESAEGPARATGAAQPKSDAKVLKGFAAQVQTQQQRAQQEHRQALAQAAREEEEKRRSDERRRQIEIEKLQKQARKKPVGPNWKKPGQMCRLPNFGGKFPEDAWLIHERMESSGKYRPWLFFNNITGKYYEEKDASNTVISIGIPHDPQEHPLTVKVNSASLPSPAGKKIDMTVLLTDLHKTGFLVKQPLEFLDRPASLFVLCDGLRNTSAASEFCAKRFHSMLLPRLSARVSEWEDFELVDILGEASEALDALLLEAPARFAGCSLAMALLVGARLLVGSLGGTRCVLATPSETRSVRAPGRGTAAAAAPWTARPLTGGSVHTVGNADECLRVESVGNRLLGGGAGSELHARSAKLGSLEALADDKQRELTRISRATSAFAALGIESSDLQEGPAGVRKIFRRRSLAVHPDKVGETLRPRAIAAFAKLEASAKAVEAALQIDPTATALLLDVCAAHDNKWLAADAESAAALLQVEQSCDKGKARESVKRRFHNSFSRLQEVCPREVAHALKVLDGAVDAAARGTQLWTPSEEDEAIRVTRALGCSDLKAPAALLSTGLATEVVPLRPGMSCGLALLADGARDLADAEVALILQRHQGRPRAASLRIAINGAAALHDGEPPGEPVGTICAYFDFPGAPGSGSMPEAKRARTMGKPQRVRVSHLLLKWAGLPADPDMRPDVPLPTRSQQEAERELLELLEELQSKSHKEHGALFKAAVVKRSECASALNVPYADLGWIDRGMAEPALESVAFDTPVDCLSDIAVTSRGAHLLYRLG